MNLEATACPLCGGYRAEVLYTAPSFDDPQQHFQLRRCQTCSLVRTHPGAATLNLSRYYPAHYYGSGQQKFIAPIEWLTELANRQRASVLRQQLALTTPQPASQPPRILDIGCGRAHLLQTLQRQGWICHGLERPEFPGDTPPGVTIHRGDLESVAFSPASFDLIILWHVLEHLPEPLTTLHQIHRLLRPGGILALAVPNFASWQARYFKGAWPHLDLPRHLYHFTPQSLDTALQQSGLHPLTRGRGSLEQDLFGTIQGLCNRLGLPHNALFHHLKGDHPHRPLARIAWGALALALLPIALLEWLLARFTGNSATLILYATKENPTNVQ